MTNKEYKYVLLTLISLLVLPIAFAPTDTVTVAGTVTNQPPVISAIYVTESTSACTSTEFDATTISVATHTPGTDYLCIRVVVADPNGDDEIDINSFNGNTDSNIMIYKNSGSENLATSNKWDYHLITQFKACSDASDTNVLGATDGEVCAQLAPDTTGLNSDTGFSVKDLNGLYRITAFIQDANGNTAADVNRDTNVTLATVVGVSLSETSCSFTATSDQNIALDCTSSGNELITATHQGNIPATLALQATTQLSGPNSNTIAVGSFKFATSDLGESDMDLSSQTAIGTSQDLNTNWTRGIPDTAATQDTYLYLDLPLDLQPGSYTGGVLTYTATAN